MSKTTFLFFFCFVQFSISRAQKAEPGKPLPPWKAGMMDLHHINTGAGNAAYYVFPDGTSMVFDAGELNPTGSRANTPRNATIVPNHSKKPFEWIVHYIQKNRPVGSAHAVDYAVISHFHDDHFGSWYPGAPPSSDKKFIRSGITGVGDLIPIATLIDRGYPSYNYPVDIDEFYKARKTGDSGYLRSIKNYRTFIRQREAKGLKNERLIPGSRAQIRLLHHPDVYPDFYVRNIKSNGRIWTGRDTATEEHFPDYRPTEKKTWPDENALSNAITINYGPFTYYTGGDNPGNVFYGDDPNRDVESVMAAAIGPVDVATLDHHGNRDAVNENLVQALRPRVWIGQTWSSDHPGHEVLIRMTTPFLYDGPRDIFSTNMLEANRIVIGPLIDKAYKSQRGHVVVRVLPGGKEYYVIVLDDTKPEMPVKLVSGPYQSKRTNPIRLIGHRGGVVDSTYTENSTTAMKAAYRRGYHMIEVDVRLSKDSQLIMHHNPDFVKYYHLNRRTQELDWKDIKELESDRDGVKPVLLEDALKYCSGRLQVMIDNKITGNDTASFRKIEQLLSKYHLLEYALFIGTTETRNYFTGKAKVGCPMAELKELQNKKQLNPDLYYLFEHGNVLTEADVRWAQQNKILVVPSINKFHYTNIGYMEGGKRDIANLRKWGVELYQIDSEYDQFLK